MRNYLSHGFDGLNTFKPNVGNVQTVFENF